MNRRNLAAAACVLWAALAGGCSSAPASVDPLAFQKEGMAATDPKKIGRLEPGSAAEGRAIARFKDFFAVWNAENIHKKIRDTYADDLYFNDTLKSVRKIDELEAYMVRGAEAVESCTVSYRDVLANDGEYYFHWRMDIYFKKFKKGTLQSSFGISHVRFDKNGKVVYHQDYWDAATNFFEKIPVLGSGIRFVKGKL